ncbi:MAG: lipoyl domain-containing protein [Pirellulales bacterium]|nr:lipoyl domain-containing protein [Pirellulales bacterium]
MPRQVRQLVLPELGLGNVPIIASQWLVRRGARVCQGESVLEVLAGDVTIDLPAPVSGVLSRRLVAAEAVLQAGQALALFLADEEE